MTMGLEIVLTLFVLAVAAYIELPFRRQNAKPSKTKSPGLLQLEQEAATLDPDFVAFERSLGGWAEPHHWEALELEARERGWPEALSFGKDYHDRKHFIHQLSMRGDFLKKNEGEYWRWPDKVEKAEEETQG